MKVKCISQCQKDRKEIFVAGEIYDISEEMYNKNTEYFEKVKQEKNNG